ncbi:MAG: phosphatidylglycerophosphatase A family protein [Planctomycetota bacterium]|jgi:phosphatidylglycerophosphatase A
MSVRYALLTVFGLGLLRPAPGSWGSTPPPALVLAMLWFGAAAWMVNTALIVLGALFAIACAAGGGWAEKRFGRKDPRQVVADETAGQSAALLFLPWQAAGERAWAWNIVLAATAFVAFRIFDIIKPPPGRALERVPAGWGILLDDLVAGVYALGVTQLLARFVWQMA